MKPVAFEYERPQDIGGALALADSGDIAVKFLAGGQSLGPMLNLRLAQPDLLVDLTGIAELKHVETKPDALELGACITHADIEDGRVPDVTNGALAAVACGIAYRAVRNRGTIGGSVAHADPAADWITFLVAIGAQVVIHGRKARRSVPVEDFMTGVFETVLAHDELVTAVRIPKFSADARWGYYKACRKVGEFAHASGAILHDPARSVSRAVIGAIEARPIVFTNTAELYGGAGANLAEKFVPQVALDAMETAGVKDRIEQKLHLVALRRAVEQARAR
jgi:aerobic carbon-monoxide dehydrogenase medium subunit